MQLVTPVDADDVIQRWLNSVGVHACAQPLPRDLAGNLPLTLVQGMGGGRADVVRDVFNVRLYTWAETDAEAAAEAARVAASLQAMEREEVGGAFCRSVELNALPYPAHDTNHPDLPRMCFTARVGIAASVGNQD